DSEHEGKRFSGVWCSKVLVDLHRFLGIDVHDVHEPARIVGTDGNHHEVKGAAPRAELRKGGMVRRVAGEVSALALQLEREAAPERLVPVSEPTSAEMSRGRRRDAQAADCRLLPPVQFDNLA